MPDQGWSKPDAAGRRVEISAHVQALVERLMADRRAAKVDKDYVRADGIRGILERAGVVVMDGKSPDWVFGEKTDLSELMDQDDPAFR